MTSTPPESDRPTRSDTAQATDTTQVTDTTQATLATTQATPAPSAAKTGDSSLLVEVFDQPFHLASSSSDADEIRQAAAYLDEKMRAIASKRGRGVALELAILAGMEVAEEMLSTQQRREHLLADADEQIGRFTQALGTADNEQEAQA